MADQNADQNSYANADNPVPTTYSEARRNFSKALIALGIDESEARREAEIALMHVTKSAAHELLLKADSQLLPEQSEAMSEILSQRLLRKPLQYALGETYFMGFKFAVGPGVLIPRPDTEIMVEAILAEINQTPGLKERCNLIEVGAGSGAIVISLLKLCPNLIASVFEISPQAAHFCRINALCHGIYDRLNIIEEDYLTGLPKLTGQFQFDLFCSNPPYIPVDLARDLAPEILLHEPALALVGQGSDGLGFYRQFAQMLPSLPATAKAALLVELGQGQGQEVSAIFEQAGWQDLRLLPDLAGIDRVFAARTGDKII